MRQVPIIDLGEARAGRPGALEATAAQIAAALEEIGFFTITGHGVPESVIRNGADIFRRFFDLPEAAKRQVQTESGGAPRGYVPFNSSSLSQTLGGKSPPDLKESFGVGPATMPVIAGTAPKLYRSNRWPAEMPDLQAAAMGYYAAMEALSRDLLTCFAAALHEPPAFFLEKFEDHNSSLRIINYPEQTTPPEPGQLRAGEHSDYGALTILLGDNVPGGLQVRTRADDWIDVAAPAGSFVINVGDLMMCWTNDKWLSNLHRVANPPPSAGVPTRRQSIAYFCNPREDVLIECIESCRSADSPPRHAPVRAGDHRLGKIVASVPVPA